MLQRRGSKDTRPGGQQKVHHIGKSESRDEADPGGQKKGAAAGFAKGVQRITKTLAEKKVRGLSIGLHESHASGDGGGRDHLSRD